MKMSNKNCQTGTLNTNDLIDCSEFSQSIIKFEIISNDKIELFLSDVHYFWFENKQMETERTSSLLSEIKEKWQKMLS
jgi:hypothetical protein